MWAGGTLIFFSRSPSLPLFPKWRCQNPPSQDSVPDLVSQQLGSHSCMELILLLGQFAALSARDGKYLACLRSFTQKNSASNL